jgi:tRNA A-37 threonylcarbamoyl transferase component Bud32
VAEQPPEPEPAEGTVFEFDAGASPFAPTVGPAPAPDAPGAPPAPAPPRYEPRGTLGRGGMGTVARALDRELGREVALKSLLRDTPTVRERFLREARITGLLEHPGIVPIYDLARDAAGRPFYTMRIVHGRTLAALLADVRAGAPHPTLDECVEIFLRACDAVAFAHSRRVVHRDLKPENVMVGDFGQVLVVDWGLARQLGGEDTAGESPVAAGGRDTRTLDGTVLGTPSYMPPEQAEGRLADVDERSDVYSLGAILYEICALAPPFGGDSTGAVLAAVCTAPLVPPRERAPGRAIPPALEAVVLAAMARDPAARPASVVELQRAVRTADVAARARAELGLRRADLPMDLLMSAVVGLHRTHVLLARAYQAQVAPWGLVPPQVNQLRIVHGSRAEGVTADAIYRRQIWTDYDFAGSLAGLEAKGLVRRVGDGPAARYFATPEGATTAESIIAHDEQLRRWFRSAGLGDEELRRLTELLERLRRGELAAWAEPPAAP